MSASLMPTIEPNGLVDPHPLDGTGEIGILGTDEQMIMIVHQYIGMDLYLEAPYHLAHALQESEVIFLVMKDLPLFISPRENMVKGIRGIQSNRSGHKGLLP